MSIYGHAEVKVHDLKKWVSQLSVDDLKNVNIAGESIVVDEIGKKALKSQLKLFKNIVNLLNDDSDWRISQSVCSPFFYNAFFKVGDSAIRIANYYECLVVASDIETKKRIIKGFDNMDIGAINLYDQDKLIGCIGEKSNLLWSTLYDYFIFEDESGVIIHTIPTHEEYMSIQLTDINNLSIKQIEHKVKEILLKCSVELGLNFSIVKLDKKLREIGVNKIYNLQINQNEYEIEPLMYFDNAISTKDVRMQYLSYYQVLEYFYNRAQNY